MSWYREEPLRAEIERLQEQRSDLQRQIDKAQEEPQVKRLHQGVIHTADECPRQRICRPVTVRNRKYLAFIRKQRCLIQPCERKAKAAHTGAHGMGLKGSDLEAVPLCDVHHLTHAKSYHNLGERRFVAHWGLDLKAAIRGLQRRFGKLGKCHEKATAQG